MQKFTKPEIKVRMFISENEIITSGTGATTGTVDEALAWMGTQTNAGAVSNSNVADFANIMTAE